MPSAPSDGVPFDFTRHPDHPRVSTPRACAPSLTPDGQAAVRSYVTRLGPELRRRHGDRRHHEAGHVWQAILELGLSVDHACWGYLLFCSPHDFSTLHTSAGATCDADAMRTAVAETFFAGNLEFDATEVAAAIAEGTTESATGWLACIDWSFLFDW